MKIYLLQKSPKIGDVVYNLHIILEGIKAGFESGASIVCFPELFLTGYPLEDRIFLKSLRDEVESAILKIKEISKDYKNLTIAFPSPLFEDGTIFNSILLIKNGEIVYIVKKTCLVDYGVFAESRHFSPGSGSFVCEIEGRKIIFAICEDIWRDSFIKSANSLGADLIIVINASPFERGKFSQRLERMRLFDAPSIYLNQVLGYDEIVFDGKSFAISKNKDVNFVMKEFEEDELLFDFENPISVKQNPDSELESIYKALVFGLKEYCRQGGITSVLLGLSGGIDSALCAKIALDALGRENALCVFLPSLISSKESTEDAMSFINLNGLDFINIPINQPVLSVKNVLSFESCSSVTDQNLQSRMRGLILMALSNQTGNMLLTTGNKSELSVGYCTIYGDTNGGFNPIKDLFKTEVFEICKFLNAKALTFPEKMLIKPPTAELLTGQTDETSLGLPYKALDFILREFIENNESETQIISKFEDSGLFELTKDFRNKNNIPAISSGELVNFVLDLVRKAQFKRAQSAPGTKVSKRAFGRDWRFGVLF